MQDLMQGERWWSESTERYETIADMPCPYALRCLAKLERKEGFDALDTPLGRALKARAELGIGAEATEVVGFGGKKMMRDRATKKFRGAWSKSRPKPRRRKSGV